MPEDTQPQSDSRPEESTTTADTRPAAPRFGIRGRLKAAGVHMVLSILAFLVVLYFILFSWYPAPHFSITGGWQGVRIMLFVDLVLGPLMTLILFNPGKRVLLIAMDLAIIAAIQISAFIWGVFTVHSQRPVNLTLWQGGFHAVLEADYLEQQEDPGKVRAMSPERPPLVYVAELDVTVERFLGALNQEDTKAASAPQATIKLYRPLTEYLDVLAAVSLEHTSQDPRTHTALEEYRRTHPNTEASWFVPFTARFGRSILVFDSQGRLLDSMADPRLAEP